VAGKLNRGEGMAGALLTDPQGKQLVTDLATLAARLDRISNNVEHGRGTVGGLLVDPSVYEDMKTVLGNIERNVFFKALVRMTIKEDGLKRPAAVARPAAP
jgi:phospholipid/cholesterol/gamma-HCH transport system substrate-binding protein